MKKKALPLLFAGAMLLISAAHAGCSQTYPEFSSLRENNRYVVNPESGTVSVFNQDGVLLEKMRSTSAGTPQTEPSVSPAIIHYLLLSKGSISGLVWHDLNGNGNPDENEQGVQDIRVFIDSDNSASYTAGEPYQLTDENGLYTFSRVKPGTNTVSVETDSLPTGYAVITPDPITVNLAPRQVLTDVNFGIQVKPGIVTGTIWDQTDNAPITGALLYLDVDNNGQLSLGEPNDVTDTDGTYQIVNIASGIYTLRVHDNTLDALYHRTPVSGSNPTVISIVPDGTVTVNLTYLHKATICGALVDENGRNWANITIFIDLNENGLFDAGEPTAVTDPAGKYCFDELYPGTYTLLLLPNQLPEGYELLLAPGTVTVGAGDDDIANFVTYQPVTIAGLVWDDASGNRVREPAENGISGITVFLDGNNNGLLDPGEKATLTDAAGTYAFAGLEHGAFSIQTDDTPLRNAYIRTTERNPIHIALEPGQIYDGAGFGYQKKLAVIHNPKFPNRLSWGADGNLYMSDYVINSVFIYDSILGIKGELKNLDKPTAVATDSSNNIYVGNQGRQNVEVYDSFGNLVRTIGHGVIAQPNGLALDRENNLYVLDSAGDNVLVYNQDGTLASTIGDSTRIGFAKSIAISYQGAPGEQVGELYVADQANCTIHVFDLNGTYLRSIGTSGSLYEPNWDGKFSGLMAVDIDRDGNVHGLDNNLNVVQVFEPQTGAFLRSYNAYPPENEYRLNLQTDIAIHPDDQRVVMSNVATQRIETIATVAP
ncbi:MAG: SdrD B-like domain-containing protein [Desulfobulbaceae bacterium]